MHPDDGNDPLPASVIGRIFAILNCFTSETASLTLTEISRRTGLPTSTAGRLLGELCSAGALHKDQGKKYSIGQRLMEISQCAQPMLSIREVATTFLDDLCTATRLHVQLASLDGTEMVILDRRKGKQRLPVFYHIGDRMPLVPTAAGRILLAYAKPEVIDKTLDDGHFIWPVFDTPRPSVKSILGSLEDIRRNQYVSLTIPGAPVHSVAAPIFDRTRNVVAAVGVLFQPNSVPEDRLLPVVRATAMGITRRLLGPQSKRELPPWGAEPDDASDSEFKAIVSGNI